tara:strand:+ start:80 stop:337 length:258 start_codon:yes stop_codon:yes gene_type:complete
MPGMKVDQIKEAKVKFTVVDHFYLDVLKKGWFDSIIGVYQLDLMTIYNNKDHELHRKWGELASVLDSASVTIVIVRISDYQIADY